MGKKSKRRPAKQGAAAASTSTMSTAASSSSSRGDAAFRQVMNHPDKLIPRQRHLYPEDFEINVACIHPFIRPEYQFVCIDAEKYINKENGEEVMYKDKAHNIKHYGDCPMCFKDTTKICAQCGTVSYCSKDCQLAHWKLSHKKACKQNPNRYKFKLSLDVFRDMTDDCFEGHEFLMIKPVSEKLESLQQICDVAIESADDIFDIPGFGANQIDVNWLLENSQHIIYQKMVQKFGWTSGSIGLEMMYGYRAAEAKFMYFILCDDSFQMQLDLHPSYYGKGLFPPMPPGKFVRGNIVVYKLGLKNKKRKSQAQRQLAFPDTLFFLESTDDFDLEFEFVLHPMNKAELALLMSERCRAIDKKKYTTRMWRYHIRQSEQKIEAEKRGSFYREL